MRKMEQMRLELGQNEMTGQAVKQKRDILEDDLQSAGNKITELEYNLTSLRSEKDEIQKDLYRVTNKLTTVEDSYARAQEK